MPDLLLMLQLPFLLLTLLLHFIQPIVPSQQSFFRILHGATLPDNQRPALLLRDLLLFPLAILHALLSLQIVLNNLKKLTQQSSLHFRG